MISLTKETPSTHVDESWFFLLRTQENVRMFPGLPACSKSKSHLPKIMAIVANTRPDPSHNLDRKIGIWRICILKTAERSSKKRKRREQYEFDCTINSEWYKTWYINGLLPGIKTKMPWLHSKRVVHMQFSRMTLNSPHTGKINPEIFNSAGMGEGLNGRACHAACSIASLER